MCKGETGVVENFGFCFHLSPCWTVLCAYCIHLWSIIMGTRSWTI